MFLNAILAKNQPLVDFAFTAHQSGWILPDTYLLDFDTLRDNAAMLLSKAKKANISLYFMLKQIGRNPAVARMLTNMGYAGAVCVDFRDAQLMMEHNIPIGHVGHLVQVPRHLLPKLLAHRPEIITIYTVEKAKEISEIAVQLGIVQNIMLRISTAEESFFPGQAGGLPVDKLRDVAAALQAYPGIKLAGVTSFPCVQYQQDTGEYVANKHCEAVLKAERLLRQMGYKALQVNLPSATCCASLPLLSALGATHGEPGHSLTGTTPHHTVPQTDFERPALVYCSEISHGFKGNSYCYGGGRYPRGHLQHAMVGWNRDVAQKTSVQCPPSDYIDYYFQLDGSFPVSATVVTCFRTQIFVTRSELVLVEGLSDGTPKIIGRYSSGGVLMA